ncbi:MAG: S8 family serine peptidase [Chthoniobacteraceae bacterium]
MRFPRPIASALFFRRVLLVCLLVCAPVLLHAQAVWQGSLAPDFFGITSDQSTATNLADVTGATTFYEYGITGQNTTSWVVDAQLVGTDLFPAENLTNVAYTYATSDVVTEAGTHATFCAALLGGDTGSGYYLNTGLAYGTTLGSAAIATGTYADGSFDTSTQSLSAYTYAASHGDVLSTSIGDSSDTAGIGTLSGLLDSLAVANSHTTIVASAGNSGPTGQVGGPASGYNTISVGALDGETGYTTVASFSSVGPLQTAWTDGTNTYYYDNGAATRPGVDLVAPGSDIAIPTTITTGTDGSIESFSYYSEAGTSFATPLVAAGASLLDSTAKTASVFTSNAAVQSAATQSLVIKAVLMNSATKLTGWNNGQKLVKGVITTTQALDYTMGAGAMNLTKAFTQYTTSAYVTTSDSITYTGFNLQVENVGWAYGTALLGGTNSYTFADTLTAGEQLSVTLSWFRNRTWDSTAESYIDLKQAEIDLYIYLLVGEARELVAQSISAVSTTQELYFTLLATGNYLIEVVYSGNLFNNGDTSDSQDYGMAWSVDAVPEPGTWFLLAAGTVLILRFHRRQGIRTFRVSLRLL